MKRRCKDCGAEEINDAVRRCRVCDEWLALAIPRTLRTKVRLACTTALPPSHTDDGRQLWTGVRSQLGGFSDDFVRDFLNAVYLRGEHAVARVKALKGQCAPAKNPTLFQCLKCGQMVPRKVNQHLRLDGLHITLDHIVSIRDFVISNADAHILTIRGHVWEVYLLSECKAKHLTHDNLQPMCNVCNSSKNGRRDLDGEVRVHSSTCGQLGQVTDAWAGTGRMRTRSNWGPKPPY